jgi:hypothetical protein
VSLAAAVAMLARRIELRLAGRGRGAARLDIVAFDNHGAREVPVTLEQSAADSERLAHVISTAVESISAEHADAHDDWRLRVVVAGETILGDDSAVIDDSFASTGVFAEGSTRYVDQPTIYAVSSDGAHRGHAGALEANGSVPSAHPGYADRDSLDAARRAADQQLPESINPLTVVLSSSGSLFALSPPSLRDERRDAHRRMRRGKQRRARPTPHVQPRLFDRVSSK